MNYPGDPDTYEDETILGFDTTTEYRDYLDDFNE